MAKFIEVHAADVDHIINLDHVEMILPDEDGAIIYFAFNSPHAIEQDYLRVDESYAVLRYFLIAEPAGG